MYRTVCQALQHNKSQDEQTQNYSVPIVANTRFKSDGHLHDTEDQHAHKGAQNRAAATDKQGPTNDDARNGVQFESTGGCVQREFSFYLPANYAFKRTVVSVSPYRPGLFAGYGRRTVWIPSKSYTIIAENLPAAIAGAAIWEVPRTIY